MGWEIEEGRGFWVWGTLRTGHIGNRPGRASGWQGHCPGGPVGWPRCARWHPTPRNAWIVRGPRHRGWTHRRDPRSACLRPRRARGARGGRNALSEGGLEGPEEDVEDGRGGSGAVVEEGPEPPGDGNHELVHRDVGEDMVHQMGSRLGHAAGITGRAESQAPAGKVHQEVVAEA